MSSLQQSYSKYIHLRNGNIKINPKWIEQQSFIKNKRKSEKEKRKLAAIRTINATHEQMKLAVTRAEKVIENLPPWKDPKVKIGTDEYYRQNHWISKNPEGV